MRITTLISFMFIAMLSIAQEHEKQDTLQVKYASTITADELKQHLEILASDEYEGRETGQAGQKLAAEYIANYFREIGVDHPVQLGGYFQKFPLIEQETEGVTMKLGEETLSWIDDYYSVAGLLKNGSYNSEVYFAGYGIKNENRNDYDGVNVKDKIVLIIHGAREEESSLSARLSAAQEAGAIALLIIEPEYSSKLDRFRRGHHTKIVKLADEFAYKDVPAFYITPEAGEKLLGNKLEKVEKALLKQKKPGNVNTGNRANIEIKRETKIISSENVLGFIEGEEEKEEIIVVTAHYDHLGVKDESVYYGADDDGSGTVALLELANAFKDAKNDSVHFKRSILFMTVSGEEKGLLGSRYYTDHPVFPMDETVADLNIDMIGRFDEQHKTNHDYIYVIGADKISTELHYINESANRLYTSLELDYTYNDDNDPNKYYYRSDHYNFARKQVPVIFYFSGVHEDYHKPTDTVDKIDFELLAQRTRLVFHTAWELIMRENRIVND